MRPRVSTAILVLAGMCATGVASSAWATDMDDDKGDDLQDYVAIDVPETLPLSVGNWYLRGDIGYRIHQAPSGFRDGAGAMSGEDLEDTGTIGVGVGYRFNDYFRMDGTVDYAFQAGVRGDVPGGSVESAELDAFAGLVNAYVDLGTYGGLTPYVGGGVGAALLRTRDASSSISGAHPGDNRWNVAWALMAGVGYDLGNQVSLDLNYRYSDFGDAASRSGTPGQSIDWNGIRAHELRVGLRYGLN
jgi:opacity protein-like surface antigen